MSISRRDKLLGGLDLPLMVGVEIGALADPFVRRQDGPVIYVDHCSRKELVEKYKNDTFVKTENIVEVDAIWGSNTLDDAVAGKKVDYVVASHVIEHVPDLITWLHEIRSILKETGTVRLIVPDRRFTFDFLRQETRLSDMLNSYLLRARVPQPAQVLDYVLNTTTVSMTDAWNGTLDPVALKPHNRVDGAANVARDVIKNGSYHDVHCWVFTPKVFAQLMGDLCENGLLDFACESFYDTEPGTFDFFITMRISNDPEEIAESWKKMESAAVDFNGAKSSLDPQHSDKELLALAYANLKREREEADRTSKELQASRDDTAIARAEVERATEELIRVTRLLASSRHDIAAFHNSTSWKFTAPIRAVSTALRQLIRR